MRVANYKSLAITKKAEILSTQKFNAINSGCFVMQPKKTTKILEQFVSRGAKELWWKIEEWAKDSPNKTAQISLKDLGKWMGLSTKQAGRYVKELEVKGFLIVIRSFGRTKHNARETNACKVCLPKEAQNILGTTPRGDDI